MAEFNKEKRYVVLKLSKLTDHQKTAIGAALAEINLDESAMPECVVVEHDWPNYQEAWDAIQAIVEGRYVSNDALKSEAADAFGDGYYDGFIDGAKFQDSEDLNTKTDSGLAGIAEEAMRCSEIAEGEKSNRLGIVSRQALAAQVSGLMKIVESNALVHIQANTAEISAQAIEGAIKFCNHHMAFPVNHGKVADKVIAVDDLIMYAETLRQGGAS